MEQKRNAYKVLVGKPKDRLLGRCRKIWEDDVLMNLQVVGEQGMNWIDGLQIGTVGSSHEPSTSITYWELLE